MAKKLAVNNLHREGDSQIIVNAISIGHANNWKIDSHTDYIEIVT